MQVQLSFPLWLGNHTGVKIYIQVCFFLVYTDWNKMSDWHSRELSENFGFPFHSHSCVSCCLLSHPPLSRPVLIYSPSSFCQAVFGAMLEPVPPIPLICLLSATPRTATSSWMVAMLTMSQVRILPPFPPPPISRSLKEVIQNQYPCDNQPLTYPLLFIVSCTV